MKLFWSIVVIQLIEIANKFGLRINRSNSYRRSVIIKAKNYDNSFITILKRKLCINDFDFVDEKIKFIEYKAYIHIYNISLSECDDSLNNSNENQFKFILKVNGAILFGPNIHSVSLMINSSRYKKPCFALADAVFQENIKTIVRNMHEKAAQELIEKLEKIFLS